MGDDTNLDLVADEVTEFWVCMPCFTMVPNNLGAIHVPNGTKGRVWCPWCGDAMDPDTDELLSPEELVEVRSLKPDTERGGGE